MFKPFAALFLAASAVYASAEPVVEAYETLLASLEQEVVALEKVQQAADAPGAVASVQAALNTQQQLRDTLRGDGEKELWVYIDNTADAKQPLVYVMVRLAVQFKRMAENNFFDNAGLRELLSPQIVPDAMSEKAKLEKMRAIDHDDD